MLEKSINEEAGLPDNWHPIDAAPIIPGGAPPFPNAMGNYFTGSISPTMQHDAVFVGTKYGSPAVPTVALMPIPPSGNPSVGSAIQSTSSVTITNTTTVAAAGSTGQIQFNTGGALNASAGLTWDNINSILAVGGSQTVAGNITITGTAIATIVNAITGFQVNSLAASAHYLRGNGTDFVSSVILAGDLPPLGSVAIWNTTAKSTAYVAVAGDMILATTTGAGFTVTIPLASANKNLSIRVKKVSSDLNTVTVTASGGDLIDGFASQTFNGQYTDMEITSDGTNWWIA